jgi:hypothetical protein
VVVGIGDQGPSFFSDPKFLKLNIHEARLVVPWDVAFRGHGRQLSSVAAWLNAARRAHVTPLVSFGLDGSNIPTVGLYTGAVRAFVTRFPWVRRYTAWNEPDLIWTPLAQDPGRAAAFFNQLVLNCHGCLVIAGDVFMPPSYLGRPYLGPWLRAYIRGLWFTPKAWALHDYREVRQHSTSQLRVLLGMTRGPIWLTETGGIERRGHWPYPNQSPQAAGRDEQYLFSLPQSYRRISRIYHYQWQATPSAGWDSALIGPKGGIRPAYWLLARAAR